MSIEIFDKIASKLRLRELGWKLPPASIKEGTPLDWDIDDSFLEPEDDIDLLPTPKPNPESEPE